jgi:hypothetical protein
MTTPITSAATEARASGIAIRLLAVGVAGYFLAINLIGPFLSPLLGIWGGRVPIGSLTWRFGFLGLVFNGQFYLLLSLFTATLIAGFLGHRRVMSVISFAALAITALLLFGLPVFSLDTLQMRRSMSPAAFLPFKLSAMKAAAQAAIGIPIFLTIFVTSRRASKALRPARSSSKAAGPLIQRL